MLSNGIDFSILEEDLKKSVFLDILSHCCLRRSPILFGWVIQKWWFNRLSSPHLKWPWFLLLLRREIKCINLWEFNKKNIAFYIYYKHLHARFCIDRTFPLIWPTPERHNCWIFPFIYFCVLQKTEDSAVDLFQGKERTV